MSTEVCSAKKCRGRPTSFDRELLVSQVMELFWERGYKNLSFNEIAKRTGVTRASLYNAFTTKESLFLMAMERYFADSPTRVLSAVKEGERVGPALHRFFVEIASILTADSKQRGCLLVNCLSELSSGDSELRKKLESITRRQSCLLVKLVEQAVRQKEISSQADPRTTAAVIDTFLHGFSIYSKNGVSYDTLLAIARSFLAGLGFSEH